MQTDHRICIIDVLSVEQLVSLSLAIRRCAFRSLASPGVGKHILLFLQQLAELGGARRRWHEFRFVSELEGRVVTSKGWCRVYIQQAARSEDVAARRASFGVRDRRRGPRGLLSDGHKRTRLVSTASIRSPQRCPTPPQDTPAAAILCTGLFVVG